MKKILSDSGKRGIIYAESLAGAFLRLLTISFEKANKLKSAQIHSRFFFAERGAKKKLSKKKAPKESFALCGGRPRLRALDGAAFSKKAGENFQQGWGCQRAKGLAGASLWALPLRAPRGCVIDGFAKMSLQESILS